MTAGAMLPASTSEAQQYVQAVEKATKEVPACLLEIADLDKQGKILSDSMDQKIHDILDKAKTSTLEPRELLRVKGEVQAECRTFVDFQQTKVDRARRLYESVTNQVTSIDGSIGKLDQEIGDLQQKIHAAHSSLTAAAAASRGGGRGRKGGRSAAAPPVVELAPPPMPLAAPVAPVIPSHFVPFVFQYPGKPAFTEYVDPNEPRYCVCKQPSQGGMIACDNPTCKIEWFHNICVGVSKAPDKWICPECRKGDGMQKRSRRV